MSIRPLAVVAALVPLEAWPLEYFEHKYVGDAACRLLATVRGGTPAVCRDHAGPVGTPTTFGDLAALSGDHYRDCDADGVCPLEEHVSGKGTPKAKKVAEVAAFQQREVRRWLGASPTDHAVGLVDLMNQACGPWSGLGPNAGRCFAKLVEAGSQEGKPSHVDVMVGPPPLPAGEGGKGLAPEGWAVLHRLRAMRAALPSCFAPSSSLDEAFTALPDYVSLARSNDRHFGAEALRAYAQHHAAAIAAARTKGPAAAASFEANAQHYLADAFAAGHIRTRRSYLHSTDAEAKAHHDWDNTGGLVVRAVGPATGLEAAEYFFVAYGDGCFLAPENIVARQMLVILAARSMEEVEDGVAPARPIIRPVAVPLEYVNPRAKMPGSAHVSVGLLAGASGRYRKETKRGPLAGTAFDSFPGLGSREEINFGSTGGVALLEVDYELPLRPFLFESALILDGTAIRPAPLSPGWVQWWGSVGVKAVLPQVELVLERGRRARVDVGFSGELLWMVYSPVELRLRVDTKLYLPWASMKWGDNEVIVFGGIGFRLAPR